mgnify:FL=1
MKFMTVAGKLVQLDNGKAFKQRRYNMEVWIAFGLFLGVVFGVLVMGLMFMAKGD